MTDINNLTRQQLYDLVWTAPVEKLARELGTTGPALGKLCKQHSIPVPSRGHWARQAAGRAPSPPPLVGIENPPGADIVMPVGKSRKVPKPQSEKSTPPSFKDLWLEQTKIVGNIDVPPKLGRPHRIIARWLPSEQPQWKDPRKGRWHSGTRVEAQQATPLEFRRLRILNVLFRRLEAMGLEVRAGAAQTDFVVHSENAEVTFRLGEWIREYRRPLTPHESNGGAYKYRKSRRVEEATGLLEFRITSRLPAGVPGRWQEIDHTIGEMLPEIIGAITVPFALARQRKDERAAKKKRRLEIREQERRRAEENGKAAAARGEVLRNQARAWREADDLRAFVGAVRSAVLAGSSFIPRDQLEEWSAWALQHADDLDPLCEAPPPKAEERQ